MRLLLICPKYAEIFVPREENGDFLRGVLGYTI